METVIIYVVIVASAFAIGLGSAWYMGDDNVVEEAAEQVIEQKTGMKIDLSPDSPE